MKTSKLIAAMLIGMTTLHSLNAQDTLFFLKGAELNVSITKENSSEIYFNKWQDPGNAVYKVEKSALKKICYQNGDVDILNYEEDSASVSGITADNITAMGKAHARRYYNSKGAGTGVLLTSIFLTPLGGIFPAIACSSTKPNLSNINFPSLMFKNDPNYINGYLRQAQKIKQKKVWRNFAIGFAIDAAIVGILATGISNNGGMQMPSFGLSSGNLFTPSN